MYCSFISRNIARVEDTTCPSKFAFGILQPSMMRFAVDEARMPSLSSFFPRDMPGLSNGTMNALIPLKDSTAIKIAGTGRSNRLRQHMGVT